MIGSEITNTIIGGLFGGVSETSQGGSFWNGAWNGAKMGIVTGTISGLGVSIQYSAKNQVDLLTGKTIYPPNNDFELGSEYNTQAKPGDQLVHYALLGIVNI